MFPPSTCGTPARPSMAATSEEVVVLPFVPVTRQDPRPGQAQEQLHLAHDLGPARLGRGERLAQPRVGGREARRDRGAGDEQVGVREQRHRVGLVHAERQAHRPRAECGDRVRQLRGRPSVVGGDHRAGIGQEAAGGDARAGQPEDDGATAAEVVDRSDRGGRGRSSSVHRKPFTLPRKMLNPSSPARAATIQNRMVIFSSAQPMSSK